MNAQTMTTCSFQGFLSFHTKTRETFIIFHSIQRSDVPVPGSNFHFKGEFKGSKMMKDSDGQVRLGPARCLNADRVTRLYGPPACAQVVPASHSQIRPWLKHLTAAEKAVDPAFVAPQTHTSPLAMPHITYLQPLGSSSNRIDPNRASQQLTSHFVVPCRPNLQLLRLQFPKAFKDPYFGALRMF